MRDLVKTISAQFDSEFLRRKQNSPKIIAASNAKKNGRDDGLIAITSHAEENWSRKRHDWTPTGDDLFANLIDHVFGGFAISIALLIQSAMKLSHELRAGDMREFPVVVTV